MTGSGRHCLSLQETAYIGVSENFDIDFRPQSGSKVRFRIEKDEGFSSQKIPLGNLMKLFLSRSDTDRRLRELIIGLAPPQFDLALSSGFLNDLCSHKSGDEKA